MADEDPLAAIEALLGRQIGLDIASMGTRAVRAATSGLLAVDNTVATPLGLRPLDRGADFAMTSGTKALTGHSDVLLGAVSVRGKAQAVNVFAVVSEV